MLNGLGAAVGQLPLAYSLDRCQVGRARGPRSHDCYCHGTYRARESRGGAVIAAWIADPYRP